MKESTKQPKDIPAAIHVAKRHKAADSYQAGTSITKALRDQDLIRALKWVQSMNAEWEGLCELGVIEHHNKALQARFD